MVARRLLAWPALARLRAEAVARGEARGGSPLAAALVRAGVLTPAGADALLASLGAPPRAVDDRGARPAPPAFDADRTLAAALSSAGPDADAGAPPRASAAAADADRTLAAALASGGLGARAVGPPRPPGPTAADADRTLAATHLGGGLGADLAGPAARAPGASPPARQAPASDGGDGDRTVAAPSAEPPARAPSPAARLEALLAGARFERRAPLGPDRWRALDRRIGREVLLVRAAPDRGAPLEQDPFFREARVLAQVEHPAVPRVHDAGLEEGARFFARDLPEGRPWSEALRQRDAPALPALLRAFLDVAGAVARAHAVGLVHGRLAPERVLLGDDGRVVVEGWAWASALPDAPPDAAAAAALAPPPEDPAAARRADPARSARADVRADVLGLGRVLERALAPRPGAGRAPAPLRAIARKALDPRPARRYPTVRALQEDVRRFLDGRPVEAEPESLLGAAARLGRRHPALGAIAGALVAVLALTAVAAGGAVTARRRAAADARSAAAAARATAAAHAEAAAASRAEAARVQGVARGLAAVEAALEDARARWGAGAPDREVDAAFAAATQAAEEARAEAARALAALGPGAQAAGGPGPGAGDGARGDGAAGDGPAGALAALAVELGRAAAGARLARGSFWLRQARPTRPDRALAELRAAATAEADPAQQQEAHLGRFLAARRLAGARDEAAAALAELERAGGPLGRLARLHAEVVAAEAGAPGAQSDEARAARLAEARATLEGGRADLGLAHELFARLSWAAGVRGDALLHMQLAAQLEPSDPRPYALFVDYMDATNGLMPPWRWISGYNLQRLLPHADASGRPPGPALDPEPALRAARYLHAVGRAGASLPLLERAVADLAPLAREQPALGEAHAGLQVYLARARLAAGRPPGVDLARLEPPAAQAGEQHTLALWAALRAGALEEAHAAAAAALPPRTPRGFADLRDALLDPGVEPALALAFLEPLVPPPGRGAAPPDLHLARARALSLLGHDPAPEFGRLQGRASPRADLLGFLASVRAGVQRQPGNPALHEAALARWAEVNLLGEPSEDVAREAQVLVVARLRRLGREDAARAFAALDPVAELWVPRAWLPAQLAHERAAPEGGR